MTHRTCSVEGCEKPHKSRGWCDAHYSRFLRHGEPLGGGAKRKAREIPACSISECLKPSYGHGLCEMHLYRKNKNGTPGVAGRVRIEDPEEALTTRTRADGDCLTWTGPLKADGYATVYVGGVPTLAHRYAWGRDRGPIPDDMVIDHICHNRACVNVEHLRLATTQENSFNLSGPRSDNRLGIRNVYRHGTGYAVQVRKNGVAHGSWHKDVESAQAEAALLRDLLFGEFAGKHTRATTIEKED